MVRKGGLIVIKNSFSTSAHCVISELKQLCVNLNFFLMGQCSNSAFVGISTSKTDMVFDIMLTKIMKK